MESIYKADPNLDVKPSYYSNGVPVFEPSMDEFRDFYLYNKAINPYGMQSGIVKVVPPPEWTALLKGTYNEENLLQVKIKNPIVQNINVTAGYLGVFSLQNVERQRKYNIFQWKELLKKHNHMPPVARKRRNSDASSSSPENEKEPTQMEMCTRSSNRKTTREIADKLLEADFNIDVSDFTTERCAELETAYWKSVGYSEPMYGADMLGSLFLDRTTSWNVAHLPNVLDLMEEKIPGVNDAYLYAGLWKATFSWHLEDQDLYSINYLHFGAPKQWYSIPQAENEKFYNLMKEIFNEDYKNCPEFLRHKTFMASPQFLEKNGITCNSIIHRQGEFMITYPYGYHSGFNLGFNLAESVNFALDDWFPFAEKTQKCECISDSVGINYKQIYCKFKGIPYVPEVPKANVEDEPPKELNEVPLPKKAPPRKREKKEKRNLQCVLCPNSLPEELLQYETFELLQIETSRVSEKAFAHRICAEQFDDQLTIHGLKVKGLDSISKSKRALRCHICRQQNKTPNESDGICFQCTHPKCTRALHATCAIAGGAMMNSKLCRFHRTVNSPYLERGDPELRMRGRLIEIDSVVQFTFTSPFRRRHSGDVHAGLVQRNNVDEETLELLVYPNLIDRIEVHYVDVILGSSNEDSERFRAMTKKTSVRRRASEPVPRKRRRFTEEKASDELLADPVSPTVNEIGFNFGLPRYENAFFDNPYQPQPTKTQKTVFINQTTQNPHPPFAEPLGLRFVEETFNDH